MVKEKSITRSKGVGALLFVMALIGFATVIYRIAGYQFEYNAQFTPAAAQQEAGQGDPRWNTNN